jgi:hypothetical protein
MDFKLSINLDFDAFQDGRRAEELQRILAEVARKIELSDADPVWDAKLLDTNGNTVGHYSIVQGIFR